MNPSLKKRVGFNDVMSFTPRHWEKNKSCNPQPDPQKHITQLKDQSLFSRAIWQGWCSEIYFCWKSIPYVPPNNCFIHGGIEILYNQIYLIAELAWIRLKMSRFCIFSNDLRCRCTRNSLFLAWCHARSDNGEDNF